MTGVHGRRVEGTSSRDLQPVPGSEFVEPADLVLVAIGFSNPQHDGLLERPRPGLDRSGNVERPGLRISRRRRVRGRRRPHGQSLIVNAIAEGRRARAWRTRS